jgi:hypothetical protein
MMFHFHLSPSAPTAMACVGLASEVFTSGRCASAGYRHRSELLLWLAPSLHQMIPEESGLGGDSATSPVQRSVGVDSETHITRRGNSPFGDGQNRTVGAIPARSADVYKKQSHLIKE